MRRLFPYIFVFLAPVSVLSGIEILLQRNDIRLATSEPKFEVTFVADFPAPLSPDADSPDAPDGNPITTS